MIAEVMQLLRHFCITDYDAANSSLASDTLYKSALQGCQVRGINFDVAVSGLTNDDIAPPAPPGGVDPDIEELVELTLQKYAAEIESGEFDRRIEELEAALDAAEGAAAEVGAGVSGRRKGAAAGGARAVPVIDELKLLNVWNEEGAGRRERQYVCPRARQCMCACLSEFPELWLSRSLR